MTILRRLLCAFGSHELMKTQQITRTSARHGCPHCGGMWVESAHDDVLGKEVVRSPWSSEYHRLYQRYGYVIVYQAWEGVGLSRLYRARTF